MNLRTFVPAVVALMIAACGGTENNNAPEQLTEGESELVIEQKCGSNTCGKGTYCCNPSCGTCVPFGDMCTQDVCPTNEVQAPEGEAEKSLSIINGGESCGPPVCGKGTTCCNASCGTCTPPGVMCTQETCAS